MSGMASPPPLPPLLLYVLCPYPLCLGLLHPAFLYFFSILEPAAWLPLHTNTRLAPGSIQKV